MIQGRKFWCLAGVLLLTAMPSAATIYKCVNGDGKVVFQDFSCNANQQSETIDFGKNVGNVVSIGAKSKDANDDSAQVQFGTLSADRVVGIWGSDERHLNLMADGTMLIDIHQDEMLTGRWFKVGDDYRVAVTRNHKPVALNLNYRKAEDGLYLSSLRNSAEMIRFWRADELTIDANNRYQPSDELE